MTRATLVYFLEEKTRYDETHYIYMVVEPIVRELVVTSYKDEIATVKPLAGTDLYEFAKILSGCFEENSNFASELLRVKYSCEGSFEPCNLKGISFEFNSIPVLVTKNNSSVKEIVKAWEESPIRLKKIKDAEIASKKFEEEMLAREKELKEIDKTVEFKFKDSNAQEEWNTIVEDNSGNSYGEKILFYIWHWAKYMQTLINKGVSIPEMALESSVYCNTVGLSHGGFIFAVKALSKTWEYGDELLSWYNERYGE